MLDSGGDAVWKKYVLFTTNLLGTGVGTFVRRGY